MLDLAPEHQAIVRSIVHARLPGARLWVFGSRATGTARRFSDLDLALETDGPIDLRTLALLRDELVESDLPMAVDLLDLHAVSSSFRSLVERDRVSLAADPAHSGT